VGVEVGSGVAVGSDVSVDSEVGVEIGTAGAQEININVARLVINKKRFIIVFSKKPPCDGFIVFVIKRQLNLRKAS
jgi:hypothetical protein